MAHLLVAVGWLLTPAWVNATANQAPAPEPVRYASRSRTTG